MILIGLHGRKRAGKDTAAQFLIEAAARRGLKAVRRGFADKLKLSAARALGFLTETPEECVALMDRLKEGHISIYIPEPNPHDGYTRHAITGRRFLQWYGTEAHRDIFGKDFWVDALIPATGPANFDDAHIGLVTDVRFPNEARRVREKGGEVTLLERRGLSGGDSHDSETPLPSNLVDFSLLNDGSLEDLRQGTANFLDEFVGTWGLERKR